jgi:hypothetical protein
MTALVRGGLQSSDAVDEIKDRDLSWTQEDNGCSRVGVFPASMRGCLQN